jgi:hypothetical protein
MSPTPNRPRALHAERLAELNMSAAVSVISVLVDMVQA